MMTHAPANLAALIESLVSANHILADQGVIDAFGHVSARHPDHPDRYLLSRSKAAELVEEGDILEFDLDSECLTPGEHRAFLERFIHGEMYRARPDVMAVVHSHSPAVIPFGVVPTVPLRSISHMGAFLGAAGIPIFEIRDVDGAATDMLVRSRKHGEAMARATGDAPMVLMRGHGSTVVGASLRQAVFRAVYAEFNARLQLQAIPLGAVTYLEAAEADAAAAVNDGQSGRAWDLWLRQANARRTLATAFQADG